MSTINKLSMFFLAIYPFLWIYRSPLPMFNWGDLIFMILILYALVRGVRFPLFSSREYNYYWGWCAISLLITCTSFKITYLVPGGIKFFIFTLMLWFVVKTFDIALFKKYIRVFFIVCAGIFILQYIQYLFTGYSFSALIPFLSLTDEMETNALILSQLISDRPCSLFREPAHFAQFLCVYLPIELFTGEEKEKLYSPLSIVAIIVLLLLRSGNGLILLMIVLVSKLASYYKVASKGRKIAVTLIAVPIIAVGIFQFLKSESGIAILERSSEVSSNVVSATSGYLRIIRGYEVFDALPPINKIIGASDETVLQYEGNSIAQFFSGDMQNDLYFNGVQTILLYKGLVGFVLFLLLLIKFMRDNESVSKVLLITFIAISFVGSTYLSYLMLCALAISFYYKQPKTTLLNEA